MPEAIKKHKWDIIVISAILLVGIISLICVFTLRKEGNVVTVTVDGEVIGEYSLDVNATYELSGATATDEHPITNILVIKDGVAYLTDANCPDKTCVKRGKIKYVGQSITCLPNKLNVKVVDKANDGFEIVS